jgi:hypothetical protein
VEPVQNVCEGVGRQDASNTLDEQVGALGLPRGESGFGPEKLSMMDSIEMVGSAGGTFSGERGPSCEVAARRELLLQTHAVRQHAVDVLKSLEASRQALDQQLASEEREDLVKVVAGRSALDKAILDTRRMIDGLDRAAESARESAESDGTGGEVGASAVVVRERVLGRIGAAAGQESSVGQLSWRVALG